MPFKSEAQRRLMWAARRNPRIRKEKGISKAAAHKMTEHDTGGKLPAVSEETRKALRRKS